MRLTKDDRGGSLICYLDENNKNLVIGSLKIGASTEIQNLKDRGIPNAFVLKSGKRQWVLQASSARDYTSWQSQLINMLKQFGPVNLDNNKTPSSPKQSAPSSPKQNGIQRGKQRGAHSANTGKLLKENQELTEKIKKMKMKISNMASEIDRYKDLEIEMKSNETELKRKGQKQFLKEKEDLIAEYEVKQDNLRQEIEELHHKLEQKTADEGGRSGLKSLFGDDYLQINIDDYKSQKNDLLDDDDDEEVGNIGGGGRTNTSNFNNE